MKNYVVIEGRALKSAMKIMTRCQGDIIMKMIDHGSPFSIHDADPDMTRVVMPMRV